MYCKCRRSIRQTCNKLFLIMYKPLGKSDETLKKGIFVHIDGIFQGIQAYYPKIMYSIVHTWSPSNISIHYWLLQLVVIIVLVLHLYTVQYNGKQFTNPLLSQAHVNRSDIKSVRIYNTTPLPYCTRVHSPGTDGGEIMRYRPNTYNYYFHYSSACFSHQCAIYSIMF